MKLSYLIGVLAMLVVILTSGAQPPSLPVLPDSALTPGAVLSVLRSDICVKGYSKRVRHVPGKVKNAVYREYGIANHKSGDYEVDHLISLELGGSNDIKNLWPQSYKTSPWNAHIKDALENRLHREVCSGEIELTAAQHCIATDWIACWKSIFGRDLP